MVNCGQIILGGLCMYVQYETVDIRSLLLIRPSKILQDVEMFLSV